MYRALFTSAYFGLLRVGEITKGDHLVLAKDVHVAQNKRKIQFILRTSKTHWKDNRPQLIKITSHPDRKRLKSSNFYRPSQNNAAICPFTILREFVTVRPLSARTDEPFFIFSDRSAITPIHMRKTL